jgi:putative ABC transport system permease protein
MQVRGMILSRGMQLLLVGAVIGFACAIALSKFLQRLLYEANGANTEIYFGVGIMMLVATLLACWIPARRASRVDPMVALRQD